MMLLDGSQFYYVISAACQLSNLDQMPIVQLEVSARTYHFPDHYLNNL